MPGEPYLSDLADQMPSFFLLYLNRQSFCDSAGTRLAEEVRQALRLGPIRFLLLHEHDGEEGIVEFSEFFERTPRDLRMLHRLELRTNPAAPRPWLKRPTPFRPHLHEPGERVLPATRPTPRCLSPRHCPRALEQADGAQPVFLG